MLDLDELETFELNFNPNLGYLLSKSHPIKEVLGQNGPSNHPYAYPVDFYLLYEFSEMYKILFESFL